MTVYNWICLLGVPAILAAFGKWVFGSLKKNTDDTAATKAGVQALLRAQMINDYNRWDDLGYAPIYARDNFENCWKNYHALGANGVMDDLHAKFLALPTEPPHEQNREGSDTREAI